MHHHLGAYLFPWAGTKMQNLHESSQCCVERAVELHLGQPPGLVVAWQLARWAMNVGTREGGGTPIGVDRVEPACEFEAPALNRSVRLGLVQSSVPRDIRVAELVCSGQKGRLVQTPGEGPICLK
eukprot:TRINITY_DN8581_c0_g2_i1.p1 TRINITY_DN8581_c0_g2~~TRINITY_DN8581_c0_g2_i1.p1  ORF type:complete len:125 (-),score=4.83 TRINITY_DN8581_c0_g2_i1:405-779(-)